VSINKSSKWDAAHQESRRKRAKELPEETSRKECTQLGRLGIWRRVVMAIV
jgi:hypothetical protein